MITAATYQEAQAILGRNKRTNNEDIVRWDAGDGWVAEGYYCNRRKRIVTTTINPEGFRVI